MLAGFLIACRVDLDEIILFYSSSWRKRKEAVEEISDIVRTDFTNRVVTDNIKLIVHSDTKLLADAIGDDGARSVELVERQVVTVTPVEKQEVERVEDQFVAAPGLEGGTGRHQAEGAFDALEDMGITGQVVGICYDNAASNAGPNIGTVRLFEERTEQQKLKLPCMRHNIELLGNNSAMAVSGRLTTGPGDTLFNRYSSVWNDLKDTIDYTNMAVFPERQYLGTFLHEIAFETVTWAAHCLRAETFPRSDYRYLLQLIIVYVSGIIPPYMADWKFQKPQNISPARFIQRAIYYITIKLLSRQLTFLTTPELRREVDEMAIFCALFYGPDFLRCYVSSRASYNTLCSIRNLRLFRQFFPVSAEASLHCWNRHLNYLSPQLITFALMDEEIGNDERERLAQAILAVSDQRELEMPPSPVTVPSPNFALSDRFWPADGSIPHLDMFVTADSFLVFNILNHTTEQLWAWMERPIVEWPRNQQAAELHWFVGLLKTKIKKFHREDLLQESLTVIAEERKMCRAAKNGQMTKEMLKNVLRL